MLLLSGFLRFATRSILERQLFPYGADPRLPLLLTEDLMAFPGWVETRGDPFCNLTPSSTSFTAWCLYPTVPERSASSVRTAREGLFEEQP